MPFEIERKFLVAGSYKEFAFRTYRIRQGYLATGENATVRIRTKDDKGYLTIKGKTPLGSISRYEWEKEVALEDALELLELCSGGIIDKFRFEVAVGAHVFEVDEFLGENQGLVVAEVELSAETEPFEKPEWLGMEVSNDRKYNNSQLAKRPFSAWDDTEKP